MEDFAIRLLGIQMKVLRSHFFIEITILSFTSIPTKIQSNFKPYSILLQITLTVECGYNKFKEPEPECALKRKQ